MIIGIDARFYGTKQKGLGRYVKELVDNLEKSDLKNNYFVFLRKENWFEYEPTSSRFKKVLADYSWYGFREQFFLPMKIHRLKVDLMLFPHFNVPLFCFKPFVVVIHDLILKKFPTRRASTRGIVFYHLKNLAYHLTIYSAVKRAKKVIAVSKCTKKDILSYFKIKAEKVAVIYEGRPPEDSKASRQIKLQEFGISKPYLLYVGNVYPHKNIGKLIEVFRKLKREEKMDLQLVLVGKFDYFYKRLQNINKDDKDIVFTDYVDDESLATFYKNAALYVFPSLYEGFGLPPLEAMVYDLPVASTNSSSLPEILGRAAIYFNPQSNDEMAQAIRNVLQNREIREEMIALGKEQVKKYSWAKMAKEILEILDHF